MLSIEHIGNLKWFLFLICLFDIKVNLAQVENISINNNVTIERLYVGLRSNTIFGMETNSTQTDASFQVGSSANVWLVPSTLKVVSFVAFRGASSQRLKKFSSYSVVFYPMKRFYIQAGVMATPTTELRPNPITWQSQIETNAERAIIGGRPGAKVKFQLNKRLQLSYGIFSHESKHAHHIQLSRGNFKISTYLENKNVFSAARLNVKQYEVVLARNKKRNAFSTLIPIKNNYRFFLDLETSQKFRLNYGKIGVRKYFDSELLKGFLDLNYNYKVNYLSGGLFLHI